MALTERTEADKIEVVAPYSAVQVRIATIIERDGVEINRSFQRHVVQAGQDYSQEDPKVQAICAAVHTPEVVAAFKAAMEPEEANQ